jgi:hypothetical protein
MDVFGVEDRTSYTQDGIDDTLENLAVAAESRIRPEVIARPVSRRLGRPRS